MGGGGRGTGTKPGTLHRQRHHLPRAGERGTLAGGHDDGHQPGPDARSGMRAGAGRHTGGQRWGGGSVPSRPQTRRRHQASGGRHVAERDTARAGRARRDTPQGARGTPGSGKAETGGEERRAVAVVPPAKARGVAARGARGSASRAGGRNAGSHRQRPTRTRAVPRHPETQSGRPPSSPRATPTVAAATARRSAAPGRPHATDPRPRGHTAPDRRTEPLPSNAGCRERLTPRRPAPPRLRGAGAWGGSDVPPPGSGAL